MIVYIPAIKYNVLYQVRDGRSYSALERRMLRVFAEELHSASAATIAKRLCINEAVVIEAVVTLLYAGWLALAQGGEFVLTKEGREAAAKPTDEHDFFQDREFKEQVLMEAVTGTCMSSREMGVRFESVNPRDSSEDAQFIRSRTVPSANYDFCAPDEDSVESALIVGRRFGAIQHVFPPTFGRDNLVIRVDYRVGRGIVKGVPQALRHELGAVIQEWLESRPELIEDGVVEERKGQESEALDEAEINPQGGSEDPDVEPWDSRQTVAVSEGCITLVPSRAEHEQALLDALSEAHSLILVSSAFFNPGGLVSGFRERLIDAIARGVKVVLLWGYEDVRAPECVSWLKDLRREAGVNGSMLLFNETPTDCHAKCVVWNRAQGDWVSAVGSFNWLSHGSLSVDREVQGMDLSLILEDARIAKVILRGVSAVLSAIEPAIAVELRGWSYSIKGIPPSGDNAVCLSRVVRDVENRTLMYRLAESAKDCFMIASQRFGPVGATRLRRIRECAESPNVTLGVLVGEYLEGSVDNALLEEFKIGVLPKPLKRSGLHAKCILADDSVLITSFNFLSADKANQAKGREIGIWVRSRLISKQLRLIFQGIEASH